MYNVASSNSTIVMSIVIDTIATCDKKVYTNLTTLCKIYLTTTHHLHDQIFCLARSLADIEQESSFKTIFQY